MLRFEISTDECAPYNTLISTRKISFEFLSTCQRFNVLYVYLQTLYDDVEQ